MKRDRSGIVPREVLTSMSTAALRELLDRQLDVNLPADVNVALIREIITVLNARNGKSSIDVDAAHSEFLSDYLGQEMLYPVDEFDQEEDAVAPVAPTGHKRLGRLGLLAAVLVVLLVGITVTAQASGLDLWRAFARWTEETFAFDLTVDAPERPMDDADPFAELKFELASDAVTDVTVPGYLPDGYTFSRIDSAPSEYCAVYLNEDQLLRIQIHPISTGNATRIEKNNTDPDCYIVNGIEHHIFGNLDRYSATWINGGYECTITGIPTMEDTYKMIDSIYWED